MGREFTCGLGISPVGRLPNFVPFGGRLMPQRLTAITAGHLSICSPTHLHNSPLAHLNPLHALHRRITIAWMKTALKNSSPSSRDLYKHLPRSNLRENHPNPNFIPKTMQTHLLPPPSARAHEAQTGP